MHKLLMAALIGAVTVASASAQSVGGRYAVSGKNPNGSRYSGTAEIKPSSDSTCRIRWTTGGSTSSGICMLRGRSFSAGYVMGKAYGLVIYELQSDGTLEGLWTVADEDGVGSETLTPVR